jgi:hypothetical protein
VSAPAGEAGTTYYEAAPLDRQTKFITAAFIAAFVGFALSLASADAGTAGVLIGGGVPLVLTLLAYGFAPKGYGVGSDGDLRVVRHWFGGRRFRIASAQKTSAIFGLGGIRLLGSGGAFGWYGLFWRKGTGRYRAYITDRQRLVACDGPDGRVILSPADPEAFVAAVPSR